MISTTEKTLDQQLAETTGAMDVLFTLREEFAQWVEEAQDESKQEALENVLGHVEAIALEFKHRFEALESKLKAG